ncbi:MAG: hypothetical protein J3K34DRAFT_442807 [Monoraphidium minutum]|nr:MAG: hypothetical protein J3K34DRAFT_442807 [Monoraphidium minutum]
MCFVTSTANVAGVGQDRRTARACARWARCPGEQGASRARRGARRAAPWRLLTPDMRKGFALGKARAPSRLGDGAAGGRASSCRSAFVVGRGGTEKPFTRREAAPGCRQQGQGRQWRRACGREWRRRRAWGASWGGEGRRRHRARETIAQGSVNFAFQGQHR